jgi:FkbM family methyltransferase
VDVDATKLAKVLATIGRDERLRAKVLNCCGEMENMLSRRDFSVRDEITGPIIDTLHSELGTIKKKLSSGLEFHFKYRSKIARDFVMSPEAEPDHVWEPQTTKLLFHLAQNAVNVVIGGAYFGDHAILLAHSMKERGGLCHCFEPNPDQMEMLRLNASSNGLNNIVANQIGLWEKDDVALLLIGNDSHARPELSDSSENPNSFKATTLNTYGKQHNIDTFDLVMLDIEGGELAALKGTDNYLSQPAGMAPHLIFEVHRDYADWSNGLEKTEIIQYLHSHGYALFAVRDYQSNVPMPDYPIEIIRPRDTYLEGPPHGFNMLGDKDERILDQSIFKLCTGVSPKLLSHRDPKIHQPLNRP